MCKKERAILFSNGCAEKPQHLSIAVDDYLVAVDGGLAYLDVLGLTPDLLIGDLDSVDPKRIQELNKKEIEILRFNSQKDETDLELALHEAARRGYRQIVIAFGLGGRLDHELANLGLLEQGKDKDIQLSFDDGITRVFLVSDEITLDATPGDLISLIPWCDDVLVRETQNLAYPLRDEWLPYGTPRGVSNLALTKRIKVSLSKGKLLLVHIRQKNH